MKDVGVLKDSERFYYEPDPFTKKNLYYIPHAGIYHCDQHYIVEREWLETCHVIIVDKGSLMVRYRGEEKKAPAGSLVLLDCREPHCYYAGTGDLRMRWFHLTGGSSTAYTNMLLKHQGCIFYPQNLTSEIEHCCERIIKNVKQTNTSPHTMALYLQRLLTQLAELNSEQEKGNLELLLEDTVQYMEEHLGQSNLSLNQLADKASLSTHYYLRKFKEAYQVTPHRYLLQLRIRHAKRLLSTTAASIENIGETCGFCNTSHFIHNFRKLENMTPLQYRSLWK